MSDKVKVKAVKHLPSRGASPGHEFDVSHSEALELHANGLIEDPELAPPKNGAIDEPAKTSTSPETQGSITINDKRGRKS